MSVKKKTPHNWVSTFIISAHLNFYLQYKCGEGHNIHQIFGYIFLHKEDIDFFLMLLNSTSNPFVFAAASFCHSFFLMCHFKNCWTIWKKSPVKNESSEYFWNIPQNCSSNRFWHKKAVSGMPFCTAFLRTYFFSTLIICL